MIWLGLGTGFEALGYYQRTKLAKNPWSINPFIIQFLTLLLAPTLVAAAISVLCKHIVLWYGRQWSFLRPKLYPWVFVGTDFISIGVQVVGGAATAAGAAGQGGQTVARIGEVMVVGGVAFQIGMFIPDFFFFFAHHNRLCQESSGSLSRESLRHVTTTWSAAVRQTT